MKKKIGQALMTKLTTARTVETAESEPIETKRRSTKSHDMTEMHGENDKVNLVTEFTTKRPGMASSLRISEVMIENPIRDK
jgi:hypothetical protein